MTATDAFRAGRLAEATELQLAAVKADPADHGKRIFLFELAAFAGDWDRARRQIDAVKYDDPEFQRATDQYRRLLDAEDARRKLFSDGVQPSFLADPPEDVAYRLDAVRKFRDGKPAEAAAILAEANEKLAELTGTLNGEAFTGLRDADDLFAGVLEVLAKGSYFWVPLAQVESVTSTPPRFPRDTIWLPAKLATTVGESGDVFLPALYPRSSAHADDAVRLGRATDWDESAGFARGAGLRTLFVGENEMAVLSLRELVLQVM
ncbi:MAG TPA: type VI secretion system accessory protein TagJ [Urbifossiella sp.]|nr:type VI secretion system accessory protein TagJ [Urbifossiella sp.]